ncbi:stage II sporulation protein M [Candidatus Pacearchaeota archaeon]|nr:stage II sporulation protein M [Candidatus Pacearchaeota archaeon]
MKKKNNPVKELYKNSFDHIKECKRFILAVTMIFFAGAIIGLIFPVPEEILKQILEMIKNILSEIEGKTTIEIIGFLLLNNTKASLIGLIGGIFIGIIPIIMALANGYLLGFVAALSIQTNGIFSMWRILPHGIFELPALFISLGLGLHLGSFIFQKNPAKHLKENLKKSITTFILIILPLLVIAAIIEGILIGFII